MKIKKLKIGENVGLFEMYVTGTWRIKFEVTNDNKIIIIDLWDDHQIVSGVDPFTGVIIYFFYHSTMNIEFALHPGDYIQDQLEYR